MFFFFFWRLPFDVERNRRGVLDRNPRFFCVRKLRGEHKSVKDELKPAREAAGLASSREGERTERGAQSIRVFCRCRASERSRERPGLFLRTSLSFASELYRALSAAEGFRLLSCSPLQSGKRDAWKGERERERQKVPGTRASFQEGNESESERFFISSSFSFRSLLDFDVDDDELFFLFSLFAVVQRARPDSQRRRRAPPPSKLHQRCRAGR